nr:MAG TPA: hypothetical protein [Caudoviricetes sp.]
MPVRLTRPWRYWHRGCIPVDYEAGTVIEDDEVAKVALQCGAAVPFPAPRETKKAEKKR